MPALARLAQLTGTAPICVETLSCYRMSVDGFGCFRDSRALASRLQPQAGWCASGDRWLSCSEQVEP